MNKYEGLHPLQQAFRKQAPAPINNSVGEFIFGYKRAINFLQSLPKGASFNDCVDKLVSDYDFHYSHPTIENIMTSNCGLVAFANHPYPILDGLIIGKILEDDYPGKQVKILGNPRTKLLPEIEHFFIKRGEKSTTETCIEHVASGNPLAVFPAGFSSYYHPKSLITQETSWKNGALDIAREAEVPLQAFHISGNIPKLYNWGKYKTQHGKSHNSKKPLPMEGFNLTVSLIRNRDLHVKVGGLIRATQDTTMQILQQQVYDLGNQQFELRY